MRKYNFTAGPSILAEEILNDAKELIGNTAHLSFLEISHRGEKISELFRESQLLVKELMDLNDEYHVLFLHGGASLQNVMVPLNIKTNEKAYYIDTGIWSTKSIQESKLIRETSILASSKNENYTYIPKDFNWDGEGYLHITTNNTVHGTQYHNYDFCKGSVIADMSSDILSKEFDYTQFKLIYAGLQKNMGTAGGALVVIHESLVDELPHVARMLSYKKHVQANSLLNTPPVFAVLLSNLVLKWIIKEGGLVEMGKRNKEKSSLLYDEIDNNPLFYGFANNKDRSQMNVTFDLVDKQLRDRFDDFIIEKGLVGLHGHRSKGGYRASLYNMLPLEHVKYLINCLGSFSKHV